MTEKRFIYCFEGIEDKWETVEEYKYIPCTKDGFQDLCDMLNKLHEENEQLKRQVKEYSMRNTVNSDLYDETYEQLEKMEKNYKSLLNENEQLKKELESFKPIIFESDGNGGSGGTEILIDRM